MYVAMQGSETIGAGATVANILDGERYANSPFPAAIGEFYASASVAGVTCELNVGGMSITPPAEANAENRMPLVPDDLLIPGWEVKENKLIQVTAVDTGGAGATLYWKVVLEEAQIEYV